MKLNKWLLISKHEEEKKIRTNLKKLGCLFEAFQGALFLDMNKKEDSDENKRKKLIEQYVHIKSPWELLIPDIYYI